MTLALSSFENIRAEFLPKVEQQLSQFLSTSKSDSGSLCAEMSEYHFETGGKRLRALIPLWVYDAFGRDPNKAVALGAAIEMIHNATLVHDDLQDGDEVRRNRPTIWKKFSSPQAINCGDAMFQYAFRLLFKLDIEPNRLIKLADWAALVTLQVIEGQAQEFFLKETAFPGMNSYTQVIRGKTSGLFALPVVGAMQALGLNEGLCESVREAAMDLGMLFQIQDDLLDIYGKKGRDKIATDVAEGKISIFVAHVNEVGSREQKETLDAILKKPREQTSDADIRVALSIFEQTGAKKFAIDKIRGIQSGIEQNEKLKACPEIRKLLIDLGALFLEPVHALF